MQRTLLSDSTFLLPPQSLVNVIFSRGTANFSHRLVVFASALLPLLIEYSGFGDDGDGVTEVDNEGENEIQRN